MARVPGLIGGVYGYKVPSKEKGCRYYLKVWTHLGVQVLVERSNWHNDPRPVIIVMGLTSGYHSNTGHEHHYISGISLNYLPRHHRTQFARQGKNEMEKKKGKVELVGDRVQQDFPYMRHAVRRYGYKPSYMITNVKYISPENLEEAVISTGSKDFSKKLKLDLAKKYRRVQKKRRRTGGFMKKFMQDIFGGG